MTTFDYDEPDDFSAIEGRRRHRNRPKHRPTTQTVLIQEDEEQ